MPIDNPETVHVDNQDELSSAVARGQRLRYIRDKLLHISRKKFSDRHKDLNITPACLQNWEEARFNGLKEEHTSQLIKAFEREKLSCHKYWLLDGTGNPPQFTENNNINVPLGTPLIQQSHTLSDEEAIAYELRAFHDTHKDAVDAIVHDDGLAPYYSPGDYVAGIRYLSHAINQAVGKCCIVQTLNGEFLIRKIVLGTYPGVYSLACTNPDTKIPDCAYQDIKLFSAAPIIWWRRPVLG